MNHNPVLPKGVYVAALTPMNQDLDVDNELLVKHCKSLLDRGAQGLAILGTTGEANSFSIRERKQILEVLKNSGVPADLLMVGTGCCSAIDTIDLSKHALDLGVKNILLLPPFYYKQINDAGLFDYFKMVINKIADPDLQIYLYHFPKMTGVSFSMDLVDKLISLYPKNIVGMKDSSGDVNHMRDICSQFPGFRLFAGTERYLLQVLQMGGAGCISATANVTIKDCVALYDMWPSKNAGELQEQLSKQRDKFEGMPFVGILKQYIAHTTENHQWLNLRPPNSLVNQASLEYVLAELNR